MNEIKIDHNMNMNRNIHIQQQRVETIMYREERSALIYDSVIKFLLAPITNIVLDFVFGKEISDVCGFAYCDLFEIHMSIEERSIFEPFVHVFIRDNLIYRLEKWNGSNVTLYVYDDTKKSCIHKVKLENDGNKYGKYGRLRYAEKDSIVATSLKLNDESDNVQMNNKLFVSSRINGNVYVFCVRSGKLLEYIHCAGLRSHRFSRLPFHIRLIDDKRLVILSEQHPNSNTSVRSFKIYNIDETQNLEFGRLIHQIKLSDAECFSKFCIDEWNGNPTIYAAANNYVYMFDIMCRSLNINKMLNKEKSSVVNTKDLKIFPVHGISNNTEILVYNGEIYAIDLFGNANIYTIDDNLDVECVRTIKLDDNMKFKNNESCSEFLLIHILNNFVTMNWDNIGNKILCSRQTHKECFFKIMRIPQYVSADRFSIMIMLKCVGLSASYDFISCKRIIEFVANATKIFFPIPFFKHNPFGDQYYDDNREHDINRQHGDNNVTVCPEIKNNGGFIENFGNTITFAEFEFEIETTESQTNGCSHILLPPNLNSRNNEILCIENGKMYIRCEKNLYVF